MAIGERRMASIPSRRAQQWRESASPVLGTDLNNFLERGGVRRMGGHAHRSHRENGIRKLRWISTRSKRGFARCEIDSGSPQLLEKDPPSKLTWTALRSATRLSRSDRDPWLCVPRLLAVCP